MGSLLPHLASDDSRLKPKVCDFRNVLPGFGAEPLRGTDVGIYPTGLRQPLPLPEE